VLPSNALYHGPQRTQLLLLRVRWNVYTESLPRNGSIHHNRVTAELLFVHIITDRNNRFKSI
jgi:hypothetical protein